MIFKDNMPDTSPLNDSKFKTLKENLLFDLNTRPVKYDFEKIKENFKASYDCSDLIKEAREREYVNLTRIFRSTNS